ASPEECSLALRLGGLLARNGFTVVCGGGSGVMEAVCRGAVEAGGAAIGILPGADPAGANPWVTIPIPTGMGTLRNRLVAITGSVLVAVGGRFGTLSEIAYALEAGHPVCAMGQWASIDGVTPVDSPEEALEFILERTGDPDAQY
ncbi:MAG: TIGR00725 family protein, partial [Candidatus Fermentibacteraceae bacterium]|nr:TIGR00725 family protein [Candidatus Fermentibacteraceae bacterium]